MPNKSILVLISILISLYSSEIITATTCSDCTGGGDYWCGIQKTRKTICSTTANSSYAWCTKAKSSCKCLDINIMERNSPCANCLSEGCSYCGTKALNPQKFNIDNYFTCFDENVKFFQLCNSTVPSKSSCSVIASKAQRDCFVDKSYFHNVNISPYIVFTVNKDGTLVEYNTVDILPSVKICNPINITVTPYKQGYDGPGIYSVNFYAKGNEQVDICRVAAGLRSGTNQLGQCDVVVNKGSGCNGMCNDSNDCTGSCNRCVNQECIK